MHTKFFDLQLDNPKNEMIFEEAITALNKLVDYYQEIEQSKGSKLTIKLEKPWDKQKSCDRGGIGIGCVLLLEPIIPLNNPILKSLQAMGFKPGIYSLVDNKFRGIFNIFDTQLIAEIPKKCQQIIGENKNSFGVSC